MSFGGFGGGSPMFGGGGGSRSAAAPGGGLPFAGIPPELQSGVDKLLADEPDYPAPSARFSYRNDDERLKHLTLRGLVFRQWRLGVLAVLLVCIVSVTNQVGPALIAYGIDHGMVRGHRDFNVVVVCAVLFLLAIAITAATQSSQARVTGRLAARVMNDLRVKVFTHLQRLGLDYYTEEKAGVIMTRMTSDIENLQQLLQDGLAQLVGQALTMVVITVILFTTNVELTLITLALVVPILTLSTIWFSRASERGYMRVRDGIAGVLGDLSESLHGVRTVAAYNRQRWNVVEHRNVVRVYRDANNSTAQINALYGPGTQMLGYLGQGALLAIGGNMVLHHKLSARRTGRVLPVPEPLLRTDPVAGPAVQHLPAGAILGAQAAHAVRDRAQHAGACRTRRSCRRCGARSSLTTSASATSRGGPVLRDVNLRIAPGETVAFVGQTGAGKSTAAKLITRFYDPTEGSVRLDGHDLREVTLDSLRRQLGVVPQEPFLFAGSLRYNIAFARPDASDAEVWAAVDAVGLRDVVERMPDGLDSVVHERGQSLSSGERQLIALARAFHAQPRVLVLDEATSNLDLLSETKIEAALDILLEARTAVLIAHRLTTAMKADRIVVVDDGRIIETGSHDELVARGGRYAEMYATWTSQMEVAA